VTGTITTPLTASQLATLKNGQVANITIAGLSPDTNYQSQLIINGAELNSSSNDTITYRTLSNNGGTIQPSFNSQSFSQTAVGEQNINVA